MSEYLWLAEIDGYDAGSSSVKTTRIANRPFVTQPGETPANTVYEPRLLQPALMQRDAFDSLTTSGNSRAGYGDCVANNQDGGLDTAALRAVDGRAVTLRRAKIQGAPPAYPGGFTTALKATMQLPVNASATLTFKIRDQQYKVQVPFQTTKYAGNNVLPAGLEGVGDLAGKPKPVLLGKVRNITPVCVNTDKQIYQISDGAIHSVDAVRDSGVALNASGAPQWQVGTSPISAGTPVYSVKYGGGLWVVVSSSGTLYSSPDGQTWTSRLTGIGTSAAQILGWNGTSWLLLGPSNTYTSPDGITWTSHAVFSPGLCVSLDWSPVNSLWVAVANVAGHAYTSPDGLTWTTRTVATVSQPGKVLAGLGVVILFDVGGNIFSSLDCVTWVQRATEIDGTSLVDAVFTGTMFFAVGAIIATSLDGLTWRRIQVPWAPSTASAVTFADGRVFIARGVGGYFSTDGGVTLTLSPYPGSDVVLALASDGTRIVAFDRSGGLAYTTLLDYANTTDLLNDALAPAPGGYAVCLSGGYFRLGTKPIGALTCDATQGSTAANRTAAQLFTAILQRAGLTSSNWNAGDVTALDTANSAVLGYWSGTDETTCDAVIDLVAQSVGAWWAPDAQSVFRIQRLDAPSGTPDVSFVKEQFLVPLEPVPSNDANGGIPPYQTTIRGAKNYTVQTTDLATGVSNADRAAFGLQWLDGIATDASVQTRHPLSQPVVVESLFANQADAQTESTRRQALMGVDRRWFQPVVELDDTNLAIELGQVAKLTHPRFGLASGQSFRVLGIQPDAQANRVTLSCWG